MVKKETKNVYTDDQIKRYLQAFIVVMALVLSWIAVTENCISNKLSMSILRLFDMECLLIRIILARKTLFIDLLIRDLSCSFHLFKLFFALKNYSTID